VTLARRLRTLVETKLLGRPQADSWPFSPGKYQIVDPGGPVVIVLPGDELLAMDLADLSANGICLICRSCQSARDVRNLLNNIAANMAIHYVLVAGDEENRLDAVEALANLLAPADRPVETTTMTDQIRAKLRPGELESLAKQVRHVDMVGCTEVDRILTKVNELVSTSGRPNTGFRAPGAPSSNGVERVIAARGISPEFDPDKAGRYGISASGGKITVEHRNAKNEVLRVVEGSSARDLCLTLIRNGWVSKLDHAAYLGRELTRAEIAMRDGEPYSQDADL
jgi:tetrahydromethanopterin S-methyltransferase subunit A